MKEFLILIGGFALLFWIGVKLQRWVSGASTIAKKQKEMLEELKKLNKQKPSS